jgi:hypothetical protein
MTTGRFVNSALRHGGGVRLTLDDASTRDADHVLLGTGYRVRISGYKFLQEPLLGAITQVDGYPRLGPGLETSVPGLHIIGAPAAWSFGPLMRFVAGTEFAGPALARRIRSQRA